MFCCFLKCCDSENYFGFLVDIFSELVQTFQKPVRLSKLKKHLSYAQNTDPPSVDNDDGLHKRNFLKMDYRYIMITSPFSMLLRTN